MKILRSEWEDWTWSGSSPLAPSGRLAEGVFAVGVGCRLAVSVRWVGFSSGDVHPWPQAAQPSRQATDCVWFQKESGPSACSIVVESKQDGCNSLADRGQSFLGLGDWPALAQLGLQTCSLSSGAVA